MRAIHMLDGTVIYLDMSPKTQEKIKELITTAPALDDGDPHYGEVATRVEKIVDTPRGYSLG